MKKQLTCFLFLLISLQVSATQLRGGYIGYKHVTGLEYELSLTLSVNIGLNPDSIVINTVSGNNFRYSGIESETFNKNK
ncbi:MAG: hypothetical protein H0X62_04230 [Bacteroidetes bacterium]|nr:hypothetical protein [Bacteroidota bacterium]